MDIDKSDSAIDIDVIENEVIDTNITTYQTYLMKYLNKFMGEKNKLYPLQFPQNEYSYFEIFLSTILSFIYIIILGIIDRFFLISFKINDNTAISILIAAFAATALIVFTSPLTPFAQPRNVFFGHCISSIIAILVDELNISTFLKAPVAVSLCCFIMRLLRVYHPPGSANALGYILSSKKIGWFYTLTCGGGAIVGIIIATLGLNLNPDIVYPVYW
jgi:CBS-domain-containing membrane protein